MHIIKTKKLASVLACGAFGAALLLTPAQAQEASDGLPSREEMWRIIQQQQKQIDELTKLVKSNTQGVAENRVNVTQTKQQVEETQTVVAETQKTVAETKAQAERSDQAVQTASAQGATQQPKRGWWDRTSLGGYGELHYNGGAKQEIDFHRFVLFFGHEFNDRIRLFSELELEHAFSGDDKPGEVELEQAYIEFDFAENQHATAGVQLIPVGILNETHEPPTFYGVERNEVEANIIPTTWWEAGIGAHGEIGHGLSYNTMFHSGLSTPVTGSNAFRIRSGRQKVAEARADNGAITGRLAWNGVPGIEIAATGQYQFDLTQGQDDTSAYLVESHIDAKRVVGPVELGLRALWAGWFLDSDSGMAEALGRDRQNGWYVEPSLRIPTDIGDFGLFTRYASWDNFAGDLSLVDTREEQINVGMNFWPHPDVVLKVDYQFENRPAGATGDDRIDLGVGFQF